MKSSKVVVGYFGMRIEEEAKRLWVLGEKMGVSIEGDEKFMLKKLMQLEKRDKKCIKKIEWKKGGEHNR